jgi:hypothetical protein
MNEKMYKLAGKLRASYHKKINNTYIWSSLARDAVELASKNEEFLSTEKVQVPTRKAGKKRTITRKKSDLIKILTSAGNTDFNFSIHTYIVAQVEAFFSDLIRGVLRIDKRKLRTRIQGIDHTKKVDVDLILSSESIEEVIEDLIDKELIGIFYASPEKQFQYLQRIVGVDVDESIEYLFSKWKEYKAARDLIVHNHGVINDIYISKSGEHARGVVGDSVVITGEDIDSVVADSKSLIGRITNSVQQKNKV